MSCYSRKLTTTSLVILSWAVHSPNAAAQETPLIPGVRAWRSASNPEAAPFEAILLRATTDTGIFDKPVYGQSNQRVEYPWDIFSEDAKALAELAWLDRDDKRQFEVVADHLAAFEQAPSSKADVFKSLHRAETENPFAPYGKSLSPYAGLWASVAVSAGYNDPEQAIILLNQVKSDIELQQQVAPERHLMTLTSALNNLGIYYIKTHQGNSAAAQFVKAIEVNRNLPAVVRHNATQLSELTTNRWAKLDLSVNSRRKLASAIASSRVEGQQVKLPEGWLYALDFNIPPEAVAANKYKGIDAPLGGMEIVGIGSGVVIAPGTLITARSVVFPRDIADQTIVTVSEPTQDGSWKSMIVSDVLVVASEATATSSSTSTTRSSTGLKHETTYTQFRLSHPKAGETSGELAALHVSGLRTKPAFVSAGNEGTTAAIEVLGWSRTEDLLARGVQFAQGTVSGSDGEQVQLVSARIEGANRGGAVMDQSGSVCGVAFDSDGRGGGKVFHIEAVRRWLDLHAPRVQVSESTPSSIRADVVERTTLATLPVIVWAFPADGSVYSQVVSADRPGGGLFIRDNHCVNCKGSGFYDCTNCNNGVVPVKKRVLAGVTSTGKQIFRTVVEQVGCDVCQKNGRFTCEYCKEGKL